MRIPRLPTFAVFLLVLASAVAAQQPAPPQRPPDHPPVPQRTPIVTYIHQSWDLLQRSMNGSQANCASFPQTPSQPQPVLYLPEEQRLTRPLRALQEHCHVSILHLPRRIHHEADLLPSDLTTPGLLYLPNPYVAPGGRFNEMFGWDSYFIILGELSDNRLDLARGTVENFFYEIDHYGALLNANQTDFLTRSQPPFLSSMVLAVYNAELRRNPKHARAFLQQALPYLLRDHQLWVTAPHIDPTTGLSRYFDLGQGPAPEVRNSGYYTYVIRWLLAHPSSYNATYLEKTSSCIATTCPQPNADGYELTASFYEGDRSMRESGFDTSFRFGPFSGSTQDFAPVGLNTLLYKYERDLAFIYATLDIPEEAIAWSTTAGDRLQAINSLLWDNTSGLYFDLNLRTRQLSTYRYLTTFYPLWAGVASPPKAARVAASLPLFEQPGGLAMSTFNSGEQWDYPYGWAPANWLATVGLLRYGYVGDALRIARQFTNTIATNYNRDGAIREKYNVADGSANVHIAAGYKENVIGFGWTNAVYLGMERLLYSAPLLSAPPQPPPPDSVSPPASPPSRDR